MKKISYNKQQIKKRVFGFFSTIGPGIFILGYTIGTGSVTTMALSGAKFGMGLVWAVGLSCLFTYVLIISVGRSTIVAGQTIITSIKKSFGTPITVFLILGLMTTVITSIMGVTGIVADIVMVWTKNIIPGYKGIPPIITAIFISGFLYLLFLTGSHQLFLKTLAVIVSIMTLCFIVDAIIIISEPAQVIETVKPIFPLEGKGHLVLAGMVGTTMASVVIISRSYLVDEEKWSMKDLKIENRDAIISISLTFIVSAAIVASAAGTLHLLGLQVENAIDMVRTLEPLAGRFATSIFVVGLIAAGLSSLFPNYVLGPWLIFDFLDIPRDMKMKWVKIFVAVIAMTGLTVPVFGGKPVFIMIASQAISPIVMPLIIILAFIFLNSSKYTGEYRNPLWINIGLIVAFIFSLFISYSAFIGLFDFIKNI